MLPQLYSYLTSTEVYYDSEKEYVRVQAYTYICISVEVCVTDRAKDRKHTP